MSEYGGLRAPDPFSSGRKVKVMLSASVHIYVPDKAVVSLNSRNRRNSDNVSLPKQHSDPIVTGNTP